MQNIRILVCMKQVPESNDVRLDSQKYTIKRGSTRTMVNPSDCVALEHALRIKAQLGAHITIITMGPRTAASVLNFAALRGADELVLISDEMFSGSDSLATARVIAEASKKLGGFDVVLAGRRAVDGETGHVGSQLSILLGMNCVTNVTDITSIECREINCIRLLEDSQVEVNIAMPCILTMCGNKSVLRPPSLKSTKKASTIQVKLLSNKELLIPEDMTGINGSPTRVCRVADVNMKSRKVELYDSLYPGVHAVMAAIKSVDVPLNPIQIHNSNKRKAHLDGKIWVFAWEQDEQSVSTAEQLANAVRNLGAKPCLIYVGRTERAVTLLNSEFQKILQYDEIPIFSELTCAKIVVREAHRLMPEAILFPATIRGRNLAPQCAAMLQTGLTADCTDLMLDDDGTLTQVRPTYGGNKIAYIECLNHRPQLASVRPGVYETPIEALSASKQVFIEKILIQDVDAGSLERVIPILEMCLQSDAEVVIAGGRGVGSKAGFELLKNLSKTLRGTLGASRGAVDSGFAPYSCQIGQTGITIRPRIYLAFGISGAVHHLAGMKDSGIVVAVNNDPTAQIFSHADIGITRPWDEVAQALLKEVSERK